MKGKKWIPMNTKEEVTEEVTEVIEEKEEEKVGFLKKHWLKIVGGGALLAATAAGIFIATRGDDEEESTCVESISDDEVPFDQDDSVEKDS